MDWKRLLAQIEKKDNQIESLNKQLHKKDEQLHKKDEQIDFLTGRLLASKEENTLLKSRVEVTKNKFTEELVSAAKEAGAEAGAEAADAVVTRRLNRINLQSSKSPSSCADLYRSYCKSFDNSKYQRWEGLETKNVRSSVPMDAYIDLKQINALLEKKKALTSEIKKMENEGTRKALIGKKKREKDHVVAELLQVHSYSEKSGCIPEDVVKSKFNLVINDYNQVAGIKHFTVDKHSILE